MSDLYDQIPEDRRRQFEALADAAFDEAYVTAESPAHPTDTPFNLDVTGDQAAELAIIEQSAAIEPLPLDGEMNRPPFRARLAVGALALLDTALLSERAAASRLAKGLRTRITDYLLTHFE
jgi:hypothetical protein